MVPQESEMIEIIEKLDEVAGRRLSWDDNPLLLMVVNSDVGDRLLIHPTPVQPMDMIKFTEDLSGALALMVAGVEAPQSQQILGAMDGATRDAMAALLLVSNVWAADPADAAKYPEARDVADIPGAFEARLVSAVDCGGRVYRLERRRDGGRASIRVCRAGDNEMVGGSVTESLVRLLKALTWQAPPDSVDRPALNAILREIRGINKQFRLS